MKKLLDATEAARILNVSPQWVTYLLRTGKLDGQKLGRHSWVTTQSAIEKYQREKGK